MLTRPWLIAAIASALLLGEASAQGSWTTLKPIPQGVNEVIGAAVDGLLYVYGGERMQTQHVYGGVNLKSQPLGMFWSYDPKADTWTQLKSNPVPVHHGAAVGIGKKFYVLGGFRLPNTGMIGWYPENKAWAYDTETQSWSALPPMPTRRSPPPAGRSPALCRSQDLPQFVGPGGRSSAEASPPAENGEHLTPLEDQESRQRTKVRPLIPAANSQPLDVATATIAPAWLA